MLLDPQIKSCLGVIKCGIICGGYKLIPYDETPIEVEKAKFIKDCFHSYLETDFLTEFCWDILDSMALGNRVAEKVYHDNPINGKMVLKSLKIKPQDKVFFVVDKFKNVHYIASGSLRLDETYTRVNKDKFVIFSWKPQNNDPRGSSDLRPCYGSWVNKVQLIPDQLKHLSLFASPSLVGNLPEISVRRPLIDSLGNPLLNANGEEIVVDPARDMGEKMEEFMNNSILVIPHDAKVSALEIKGDGQSFLNALSYYNMEMAKTLLFQTQATENTGGGRSSAAVHQDIMALPIDYGISALESVVNKQIVKELIDLNYSNVNTYPVFKLPGAYRQAFLEYASALAKLAQADYIHPEQYNEINNMVNLPILSSRAIKDLKDKKNAKSLAKKPPTG